MSGLIRNVFGLLLACGLCFLCMTPAHAGAPISASFDYEVRERFALPPSGTGLGADAGELYTDPLPATGFERAFIQPANWTVDFDACASGGPISEYRWTIDGIPAGTETGCDAFSFDFESLGAHTVSLTVVDSLASESTTPLNIDVRDYLIISLGDSVASGEGLPDIPISQFDIDAADAAREIFDSAETTASSAIAAFEQAVSDLTQEQLDVTRVVALQQDYLDAIVANDDCGGFDCVGTALALAAATLEFGEGLDDLGLFDFDLDNAIEISDALDGLISIATQSRDDALSASEAAQGLLEVAQTDLDDALAALEPTWRNRRCHRSALAGPVLAAGRLAQSDPHSAVTFIHLPCSGALIETGVIGPYDGIDPVEFDEMTGMLEPASAPLPAQLDRARELVCGASCDGSDREVDAFWLSVGANDVNFTDILLTCVGGEPCFGNPIPDGPATAAFALLCAAIGPFSTACADFSSTLASADAEALFLDGVDEPPANGLDDLPMHYQALQTALEAAFGANASDRVFLTEYPDLTRDESGALCGWEVTQSIGEQMSNIPGVSPAETMWADAVVQTQLNFAMQTAATLHGWNFVGGIASSFGTHGYCASNNWITRIQESYRAQGGIEGSLHPTEAGQLVYRDALLVAIPEPAAGSLSAAALATLAAASRLGRPRRRRPSLSVSGLSGSF